MARDRSGDGVEGFLRPQCRVRPPSQAGGGRRRLMHEIEAATPRAEAADVLGGLRTALRRLNALLIVLSAVAVGAAGCVLTWEVAGRYFFKIPSDWQDELSIFLL